MNDEDWNLINEDDLDINAGGPVLDLPDRTNRRMQRRMQDDARMLPQCDHTQDEICQLSSRSVLED